MQNGQIVRLAEAPDGALAVEAWTENGLVLGRLVAPANGTAGYCRFIPDPSIQHLAGTSIEGADDGRDFEGEEPVGAGGPLTTADVPTKGVSKDDPRGLRRGGK